MLVCTCLFCLSLGPKIAVFKVAQMKIYTWWVENDHIVRGSKPERVRYSWVGNGVKVMILKCQCFGKTPLMQDTIAAPIRAKVVYYFETLTPDVCVADRALSLSLNPLNRHPALYSVRYYVTAALKYNYPMGNFGISVNLWISVGQGLNQNMDEPFLLLLFLMFRTPC